jgi:hypothetical protein
MYLDLPAYTTCHHADSQATVAPLIQTHSRNFTLLNGMQVAAPHILSTPTTQLPPVPFQ